MTTSHPQIVFAGGGTGGHLFPAVALFQYFRATAPHIDCLFLCTNRPFDAETLTRHDAPFAVQNVQPLRRRVTAVPGFLRAWRQSVRQCRRRFVARRPAVVVGTGGFGSGPAVRAAHRLGIPIALLNPDAVPGKANRLLARHAAHIYLQWPESAQHFKRRSPLRPLGCPVRAAFLEPASAADPAARRTLLITGASSGARTINEAITALLPVLSAAPNWRVVHIAGAADAPRLQQAYDHAGIEAHVVGFLEDMATALREADLVIGRAGAVTLAELAAVGRAAILLPYPFHRDQHQTHNAEVLVRRGAAVRVPDLRDAARTAAVLQPVLERLLHNDDARAAMAARARDPVAHSATREVATALVQLAGCAPLDSTIHNPIPSSEAPPFADEQAVARKRSRTMSSPGQ